MQNGYIIFQVKPENYNRYTIFDSKHPHAKFWQAKILDRNRVRFMYSENSKILGQGDLVKDYGDRNRGDETDYTISGRRIYLSRLIAASEERGRGIGGKLVKYMCGVAKKWGYKEISLGVDIDNALARELYRKAGFSTVLCIGEDEAGKYEKLLKYL